MYIQIKLLHNRK